MTGQVSKQAVGERCVLGPEAFAGVAPQDLKFDIAVCSRRVMPGRLIEEAAYAETVASFQHGMQGLPPVITQNRHADRAGDNPEHFVSRLGLRVDPAAVRKVTPPGSESEGFLRLR